MSAIIPSLDTQPQQMTNNDDDQLWNIIEKQRSIIQELQKALNEMTAERDNLLVKLKISTPATSTSSFTDEHINTITSTFSNHNKTPIPPPRSPYRSNNINNTNNNNEIDTHKNITTATNIKKKHSTLRKERHCSTTNVQHQSNDQRDDDDDYEQEKLINIQLKVKSIHATSFILSIINKRNGKELWKIEKLFTDLLSLDMALKDSGVDNKLDFLFNNTKSMDEELSLIEEYLTNSIRLLNNCSIFYSFISNNNKIAKEGYLTKRGKYTVGGYKKYYFIMNGSELKHFCKKNDQLFMGSITLVPETRIGKQASVKKNKKHVEQQQQEDPLLFQHAFIILLEPKAAAATNAYRYILCADSDSERDDWVKVLHSHYISNIVSPQAAALKKKSMSKTKKPATDNSNKLPKQPYSNIVRSNSDTSIQKAIDNSTIMPQPTTVRRKLYQRSSMDDKAILHYFEATHLANNQQQNLSNKASADSLPNIEDLELTTSESKKKKTSNRKSFWSKRKFFSSSAIADSTTPSAFPFINNNNDLLNLSYISNTEGYSTSSSSTTTTPIFQVFGVPLEEAIRLSRISENFELPAIVYRCVEYLEAKNAIYEEGIYRLSGSSVQISNLRQQFCEYGDVDLLSLSDHQTDVHVVAGLLKMWLRELPINVLTHELLNDFLTVIDQKDKKTRVKKLGQLVSMLPIANYSLLRTLIAHLIHIVHNAEHNKMTLRNVGIVFAPTLSIPSGIFTLFMSEFEYIFWTTRDNKKHQHNNFTFGLSASKSTVTNYPAVHPTTIIRPSTSADRIKQQYLKAEEVQSSRNSLSYKNNIPLSIMSLETVINEDKRHHMDLVLEQDDIEKGDDGHFNIGFHAS